jgi:predicted transcriptional regulator
MTTIKVPTELRDRISKIARSQHTTMAGAVEWAIERAETEQFWAEVRATMTTPEARADILRETEELGGTIGDGLEPEDWSEYE